jgi:hypothetical protein
MAAIPYDRLSTEDREVRLVRFDNSATSTEVNLVLEKVAWNDLPSYHALSYLWGDPALTALIRVNGKPLSITQNLHQALVQLRQGEEARAWLWIDSICINQNDQVEKSQQVAQMGDIFRQATLVYIWLGPSADDSDAVFRVARRHGPEAHQAGVMNLWSRRIAPFDIEEPMPQHTDEDVERVHVVLIRTLEDGELRQPKLLKAIESLMGRANWYRTWIVQEIALARDGYVLCGAERVSLDAFDGALSTIFFSKTSDSARALPQWQDFGEGLSNIPFQPRGLVARRHRQRNWKASLLELLLCGFLGSPKQPFYLASDPRDIIFGLLGIAGDTESLGLRPDYAQTVAKVYATATRAMMERCPQYRLEFSVFPKAMDGLPSWVPDWQQLGRLGFWGYPLSYGVDFRSSGDYVQPSSPVPSQATPDKLPSWRVLRQRGCLVDVVAAVYAKDDPALALSEAMDPMWGESYRTLTSILNFATTAYHEVEGARVGSLLWRTLLLNRLNGEKCGDGFDVFARRTFCHEVVPAASLTGAEVALVHHHKSCRLALSPRPVDSDSNFQADVDDLLNSMLLHASVTCRQRTIFATAGGKLGVGPKDMQKHDVVTILWGTSVPIVLRPVGAHFMYLGDAYVHGIMDGEFVQGDINEKEFIIT